MSKKYYTPGSIKRENVVIKRGILSSSATGTIGNIRVNKNKVISVKNL